MEKTVHGKKIKTTSDGVLIDGSTWNKEELQEALFNYKSALRIFGINKSKLCDVLSTAIEMIETSKKDTA